MVQTSSSLEQLLDQAVGQFLPDSEMSRLGQDCELLNPAAGRRFWSFEDGAAGLYIVLAGKVRLVDQRDRLLTSLEAGAGFGELALFPGESFQPYGARASLNLQIAYLPLARLQVSIHQYPALKAELHRQAVIKDLLILCRQAPLLQEATPEQLMSMLPHLHSRLLTVGSLPCDCCQDQRLWLVRRGELRHTSGERLLKGSLHLLEPTAQSSSWQVQAPTELYTLDASAWAAAQLSHSALQENTPEAASQATVQTAVEIPHSTKVNRAYFPGPTVVLGHGWQRLIRRYPFHAQQSASDCGAACLVMIGRYWGKQLSLNRLRDIANVDRNGASLRGLAAAAEGVGFATRPVKASLNKLAEQTLPAIAHWEGNHYVVVYHISRDRVVIADPAIGQRTLSSKAFNAGWTGYALLLQPTALLKDAQEAHHSLWQFFELVKPHWLVLLEVLGASILIQLLGLITPLLTQLLLDRVVVQRSSLTLVAVGLGLLIFGLLRVATTGLRQYLLDHTANRVDLALIVGFIRHTFRLPLQFFESRYVGDIISRVQENRKIQRFLTGEALAIGLDLLTVFVYVGLMLWYSWKMALLTLVIVPPFVLLALIATPFLQRISREIFAAFAQENSYLIEALTGVRTVKSMAIEQTVRWRWEELFSKSVKTTFSGQIIGNSLQIFSASIEAVATAALLWFGAWLVIRNELTIGQLVAFNMLLGHVITPFQRLIVLWNELQEVIIAIERIDDVIDTEPEEDLEHQARQLLPSLRGHIRFQQVTFRYHPESEANVLENLSFEILPGQTVALVGRSGSGKTTIGKLILGLYPPTEGQITIDGYDVTSLSLQSLRQQIGVVDQDTFLFGSTIRENIAIGYPGANLEAVQEAAHLAGADGFIKTLPMGYETQIGEGGGLLSGGQRQRLAIARALLGKPRLLILDEATSSLDAESERVIQTNLNRILDGQTTLVIAHRLSTVRHADQILVLDRGVLVERGTHDQLMAQRGHYFYLNQQQLATAA